MPVWEEGEKAEKEAGPLPCGGLAKGSEIVDVVVGPEGKGAKTDVGGPEKTEGGDPRPEVKEDSVCAGVATLPKLDKVGLLKRSFDMAAFELLPSS